MNSAFFGPMTNRFAATWLNSALLGRATPTGRCWKLDSRILIRTLECLLLYRNSDACLLNSATGGHGHSTVIFHKAFATCEVGLCCDKIAFAGQTVCRTCFPDSSGVSLSIFGWGWKSYSFTDFGCGNSGVETHVNNYLKLGWNTKINRPWSKAGYFWEGILGNLGHKDSEGVASKSLTAHCLHAILYKNLNSRPPRCRCIFVVNPLETQKSKRSRVALCAGTKKGMLLQPQPVG